MPDTANYISFDDALALLLDRARPVTDMEERPLRACVHAVLAQNLVANMAVPPQNTSALDGFAVCANDVRSDVILPLGLQRGAAGYGAAPLKRGTAARIQSGAALPEGADTVIPREDTEFLENGVRFPGHIDVGQYIRKAGEDIEVGDQVLPAGLVLEPVHLGVAASLGRDVLSVFRALRVTIFFSGDELTEPGEVLHTARVYNSNRYWLRAMLESLGCEVRDMGVVPDSLAATRLALSNAASNSDVVISCGGISAGTESYVRPAVEREGELMLWKVAMKPGKPFAIGRVGDADFIGLPGNPLSAFMGFLMLARPFIRKRQGLPDAVLNPIFQQLPAAFDWKKPDPARVELLRVRRVLDKDGRTVLEANPVQGTSALSSLVWADGLVRVQPGQKITKGSLVDYISLSGL